MNYSYQDTIDFFAEKIGSSPPEEDLVIGEVEIILDRFRVVIAKGKTEGAITLRTVLGLLLQPINTERLKELATSNFLGSNTDGCALSYDEQGVSLILSAHTTATTPPQENWEWLHRLLSAAAEWQQIVSEWEEFVPFSEKMS